MKNYAVCIWIVFALLTIGCGSQEEPGKGTQPSTEVKKEAKKTKEAVETKKKDVLLEHEKLVKETEAKLSEYDKEIKELSKKAFEAAADVKPRLQNEMDELQKKLEAAKNKLAEWQSASGKAWDDHKAGMEAAMADLGEAFQKAKSH